MNLPTFATLLIAATAHAADTKQHVRKAEVEGAGSGYGQWWSKPPTCDASNFETGPLVQNGEICTIVPDEPNQPGAPRGTVGGVFCTDTGSADTAIGEYTLSFETTSGGLPSTQGNLFRATLNIPSLTQNPAPGNPDRRLQVNPLLDPGGVNGGEDAPSPNIEFQGFFDHYCNFRAVSKQGGQLSGFLNPDTDNVHVEFTQSGQVTSPLTSLPGQFQDDNVVGLFVSNFAFAFSGDFEPFMG